MPEIGCGPTPFAFGMAQPFRLYARWFFRHLLSITQFGGAQRGRQSQQNALFVC